MIYLSLIQEQFNHLRPQLPPAALMEAERLLELATVDVDELQRKVTAMEIERESYESLQ